MFSVLSILNVKDLVALSGAHTIGKVHCGAFSKRLFNFTGNRDADPSLDTRYANFLRTKCPNPSDPATTVEMDPRSSLLRQPLLSSSYTKTGPLSV
ncbi:hypothetical protein IFM89_012175 [Coptis chinensis]|uniref:Plant heme peroxidase family profile domain-containing protein n=1 Tax=Coptis chinensis TaxID=261450 RepID=A0A835LIW1_9MAGN|nr:hypothetical protein IFM89_012175 [Coptis chinensis]